MMSHRLFCTTILLYVMLQNEKGTIAFKVLFGSSVTHQDITQRAVLLKTAEVCRALAVQQKKDFVLPSVLTVETLTKACSFPESAKGFQQAINKICNGNGLVDSQHENHAEYHFNSEEFSKGRDLITEGVKAVKASAQQRNYETARERLGTTLHTLQDFYSHSNWIELGNKFPYSNLIRPDSTIENIADPHQPTCRSCDGVDCKNNILENILLEKILTSGYFGVSKPPGKCSHGNLGDISSGQDPVGGINKDEPSSSHGYLHRDAANMAIAATKELLEDIRGVVGDSSFLRLMGFSQDSVLCFVIDTTGSMGDDIAEVKRVTAFIIESKKGTPNEPLEYIMVPFNDPGFGPLYRTTNPDEFIKQVNALGASGGGDEPELCLSALQLALTGSPPKTEMFVFTDASAKDSSLENTVKALIESTKSVVNFFLTKVLSARRRRSDDINQKQILSNRAFPSKTVYVNLALASGGQVIEVTKETLSQATSIIVDTSTSSLVTVFQAARNPGKVESFSFVIDSSIQNLTIYITASSMVFTITSPSGHSQTSNELSGQLGLIKQVGNFYTVRVTVVDLVGTWNINMNSLQSYTIKVVGQSDIDFLFTFLELMKGPHSGYSELTGRPPANSNINLLLTMVGGDSVTPTEVALVDALGSQRSTGTLEKISGRDYLVTMTTVPAEEFVVCVMGIRTTLRSSDSSFQRQSVTQFKASSVVITAQTDEVWAPGETLSIPFTIMHNGSNKLNITARNDQKFVTSFPTTVLIESGSGIGTVSITAPLNTPSGTDVTLTIEATSGDDFNYAVLKLSVVAPLTDFTPPVCEIVSIDANCLSNCSLSSWEVRAQLNDGSGTGIMTVTVRQGLGILSTSTTLGDGGVTIIQAYYRASCCSQELELVAVDKAGNVGICTQSIRPTVVPTSNTILSTVTTTPNTSPTVITTPNTSFTFTTTPNTSPTVTTTPISSPTVTTTPNTSPTVTTTPNTPSTVTTPITSSSATTTPNTSSTFTTTPNISPTFTTTPNTSPVYTTRQKNSSFTTTSNTILPTFTATPNTSSTSTTTSNTLPYTFITTPNTSFTLTTTFNNLLPTSTATPTTSATLSTTYNASLSAFTTTNITATTTFLPFPNDTVNSAGEPLYVCLWLTVGVIMFVHVLCF